MMIPVVGKLLRGMMLLGQAYSGSVNLLQV